MSKRSYEDSKQLLKDAFSFQKVVDKEHRGGRGDIVLHVMKVGNDPATEERVKEMLETAEEVGVRMDILNYSKDVVKESLIEDIENLQGFIIQNRKLEGIILLLPSKDNGPSYISSKVLRREVDVSFTLEALKSCRSPLPERFLPFENLFMLNNEKLKGE